MTLPTSWLFRDGGVIIRNGAYVVMQLGAVEIGPTGGGGAGVSKHEISRTQPDTERTKRETDIAIALIVSL